MNLSQSNRSLRVWRAGNGGDQQPCVQRAEIEATVEAISEGGEVSSRILSEVERMVTAGEAGFEVAQDGVDPLELGQLFRLAPGDNGGLVHATGFGDGAETGQPIREHRTSRCDVSLGPLCDRLERKAWYGCELGSQGMPVFAER